MAVNIGPKIGVDGEKEYRDQINNIITQAKTLSSEMKKLSSSFDSNNKSLEQNAQKHKLLQDQIKNQEDRLSALNSMLEKSKAKFGENATETQKWQQAVNNAETDLNNLKNELSAMPSSLDLIAQKFETMGTKLQTLGNTISGIGTKITTAVTVPLTAAATKAVTSFAEVDKTMQLTNSTMGNTAEEAEHLNDAMEAAAANSTFGMSDAATATLNFARAGLDATQAADALAPAMNLAAGEGGTLDTVSAGLVATINGFGDSFTEAERYADVFANACNNSALDVDSLSESLSVAAPIFSAAGYNIEDATLYMGTMANAGIDASTAANALKTGFARLVSPAKEGSEAMESLGLSVTNADGSMKDSVTIQKELHDAFSGLSESEQIAAASAIFGKNQMSNWLALINTAPDDVSALNDALSEEGTTAEMAEAMMGGFGGSIEKLKSSLDVLMTSLGSVIANYLTPIIEKAQEWIDKFNALSDEEKDQVVRIAAIAAAIGPMLVAGGKLLTGIGKIMTFAPKIATALQGISTIFGGFSTTLAGALAPIAAIVAAVGLLVAAFTHLWNTNEQFRTNMTAIWEGIQEKFSGFIAAVQERLPGIQEAFTNIVNVIKPIWEGFCAILAPVFEGAFSIIAGIISTVLDTIIGVLDVFIGIFTGDWEKAKEGAVSIVNALYSGITSIFNSLSSTLLNVLNVILGFFGTSMEGIKTKVTTAFTNIVSTVTSKISSVKTAVQTGFNNVISFLSGLPSRFSSYASNMISSMVSSVQGRISGVKSAIESGMNSAISYLSSLPSRFSQWGSDMIGNLISGITSRIGEVASAVANIGSTISSYLHFSEPDVGPLSNFNSWMPDMMKQMAQQIESGRARVQAAVSGVASDISMPMNGSVNQNTLNYGGTTINVYGAEGQDVNELAQTIQDIINNDVEQKGAVFA